MTGAMSYFASVQKPIACSASSLQGNPKGAFLKSDRPVQILFKSSPPKFSNVHISILKITITQVKLCLHLALMIPSYYQHFNLTLITGLVNGS